jgi:hypothetical protein
MERFNLKNLEEVEGKEKYLVEVSNSSAALEDLEAEVEINTVWETIREKNAIIVVYHFYQLRTQFYYTSFSES